MKKALLFTILSICLCSAFAANVNIEYHPYPTSSMYLQEVENGKAGFKLGYFTIVCASNADIEINIDSPNLSHVEIKGDVEKRVDQSIEFKLKGKWSKQNGRPISYVSFKDSTGFKASIKDKDQIYVLELYLVCEKSIDKLSGQYYTLTNPNDLNNIIVTSIKIDKNYSLYINNSISNGDVHIPICPTNPMVNPDGTPKPGVSKDPTEIVEPSFLLLHTSFAEFNGSEINESKYNLDYNKILASYTHAPIVQVKIVASSSDNTINKTYSESFIVQISSNGALENSIGNKIEYNLVTQIGNSSDISVSNYINQNSYKLTNIKTSTNNYAYFPIYFNFKSLESLTNSLSGTYTDTITVTITEV